MPPLAHIVASVAAVVVFPTPPFWLITAIDFIAVLFLDGASRRWLSAATLASRFLDRMSPLYPAGDIDCKHNPVA